MKEAEAQVYAKASRIITIAMGQDVSGRGRGTRRTWRADNDPLAAVLGVEAIMEIFREGVSAGRAALSDGGEHG